MAPSDSPLLCPFGSVLAASEVSLAELEIVEEAFREVAATVVTMVEPSLGGLGGRGLLVTVVGLAGDSVDSTELVVTDLELGSGFVDVVDVSSASEVEVSIRMVEVGAVVSLKAPPVYRIAIETSGLSPGHE